MADVPDDILPEILSRLPVTPLLRFRCVCRSWKGLIDSPQFINDHLNHSRKSNSNLNILLRSDSLYSEDFDILTELDQATFTELSHPLETPNSETEVLGSCNGLLVLSNGEDDIILWNPSTRRFHNIPVTSIEFPGYYPLYIVYGFGYDIMSDDYKVIRIVQYYAKGTDALSSYVKVYSVKRNSWNQIANFPYFLRVRRGNGEFVNGALHWVVGTTRVMDHEFDDDVGCLVAAFDLETEDYRLVSLPEFAAGDDFEITNVGVLGGCLSVVCNYNKDRDYVDIWVMKEYGVRESWSISFTLHVSDLFRLTHSEIYISSLKCCEVLMPIGYSNCGRKVLLRWNNCYFMWYDLDKKSCDLPVFQINPDEDDYVALHTCLKSLVLLNNNGICDGDFDIITENEKEKKSKLNIRARFLNSWYSVKVI